MELRQVEGYRARLLRQLTRSPTLLKVLSRVGKMADLPGNVRC